MGFPESGPDKEELANMEVYERFGEKIDRLFDEHREIDWLAIGGVSGDIVSTGTNDESPSERLFDHWQAQAGENLFLFGRPLFIEPTHPDPNVPSAR